MKLIWFQRSDGRWNADCVCGATCCGVPFNERGEFETWHFQKADRDRRNGEKELLCDPKFPEEDLNMPGPLVFP
jgi:hypothetical protein